MISVWGVLGFIGVGLSLGLLGGGGSILAVPVLVHLFGLPISTAVPMSLPVVGVAAAFGAYTRWRRGELRLRMAAMFAVFAMATAFAAARLGAGIGDSPRTILLAVTMLAAATAMLLRARSRSGVAPTPTVAQPAPVATPGAAIIIPAAVVVGTLTGLVGVGGGFLIVPALTGVIGISMAEATATSLAVIALNTLAAGAGYYGSVTLDPTLTAIVTAAALLGMIVGTRLAPRVRAQTLSLAFAILLVVVGTFMIWQDLQG